MQEVTGSTPVFSTTKGDPLVAFCVLALESCTPCEGLALFVMMPTSVNAPNTIEPNGSIMV